MKVREYTSCVRKVSDLRSYLRVGAILRHPDRGILRSSPHLIGAVLERRFWNGLQLARRISLNPKVAGSYVGTVRKLAKLYNLVFRQKLLHKFR